MNFAAKWFVRRKLEDLQKQLQQSQKEGRPMKMSPATKAILIAIVALVLQLSWSYYQLDKTPTLGEWFGALAAGALSAALFLVKSGRLPSANEIQASLEAGSLKIHNDDPTDPVVLKVDGKVVASLPPPAKS